MSAVNKMASRRRVLRGMMGGSAVTVALPFLDCFLNSKGTALAATGKALPVVFGNWYWGCGLTPGRWEPAMTGKFSGPLPPEIAALEPFRDKLNIYSGMKVYLDGKPPRPHTSGRQACQSGHVPHGEGDGEHQSVDSIISGVVGKRTRFRSLEVASTGNPKDSVSRRSSTVMNPSEGDPAALYARVFGPEFVDPNAADFEPDPLIMAERSALSVVKDERQALMRDLGATDRARLDEYFTSLRELEGRLDIELSKPAPLESCTTPDQVASFEIDNRGYSGVEIDSVIERNKLFSRLLAHAVACDQTRVFNVSFSDSQSSLRHAGDTTTHHILTHEEAIDEELGYQPRATSFFGPIIEGFALMAQELANIREGEGTLLDRSLVLASSESGLAKIHGVENLPLFTLGGAGGRIRTGMHLQPKGDAVTRVGLTLQQVMGVSTSSWGTGSMETTKAFNEVIV
ncbi:MAG: hypothetical protein CMG46_13435 [Candidatus Marinimicrobia bacterium]|nr:hypothetical protein [Candidatus Neomarinimicrobiota bacterium]